MLRSCVNVEMVVLSSPSLIVRTVSVDVKQHELELELSLVRAQELCESRDWRPGLPVLKLLITISISMCIMCMILCLFSVLRRGVGVLQFIITIKEVCCKPAPEACIDAWNTAGVLTYNPDPHGYMHAQGFLLPYWAYGSSV